MAPAHFQHMNAWLINLNKFFDCLKIECLSVVFYVRANILGSVNNEEDIESKQNVTP